MFRSGYIAILGAPNAGKSTLLNALVKEKLAAVTDRPQTTRKRLKGIYTTKSCQMIFLDTPGVHCSEKNLNRFMRKEIDEVVRDADILVYLFAVDQPDTRAMLDLIRKGNNSPRPPLKLRGGEGGVMSSKKGIVVINKIDLPLEMHCLDVDSLRRELPKMKGYPVSAKNSSGLDDLLAALTDLLPEGPAYYPEDDLTDENLRDIAAEIIREKAMTFLYEEIPYSLAVEIMAFKENPDQTRIEANLVVEHESQKGMVIGEGGRMIKQIGASARKEIEALLATKVFLELKVKVDKNWTKNLGRLAKYGYSMKR